MKRDNETMRRMRAGARGARAVPLRAADLWWAAAALLLAAALTVLLAGPAAADVDWHGFVEGGYGVRAADDPAFDGEQDYTLKETRAQLTLSSYGDYGEGYARLDLLQDAIASSATSLELREGYLRFRAGDHLEVKAGRQALTWGTGDLIFVNDLFPKDWVSFFIGREDQYLKAPADAVRLGFFGLRGFDLEVVGTPTFTPDRLPDGTRLSFYSPPGLAGPPVSPAGTFENGELALRLSRYIGSMSVSLYGYDGFFKTPLAVNASALPYYPELRVGGASVRGSLAGGVFWLESGYYDSVEDPDGDDPMVPNSSLRMLAGFERQLVPDLTASVQWYGEWMRDHDGYEAGVPAGARVQDELRQILTLRVEKFMLYQTLRLSYFVFYSPTDEDSYHRPMASYKLSDDVELALGGNVFTGSDASTQFGQFDHNDNVYTRVRYSF